MKIKKELKENWKLFWKHKNIIPLVVLFEVLFAWFLITIHINILTKLYDSIDFVTSIMQEKMSALGSTNAPSIGLELLKDNQFSYHYNLILQNIGYFFLISIGLFIIFKGLNWYVARRLFVKIKLKDYAKQFIPLTLFWAFVLMLLAFLTIYLSSKVRFDLWTILSSNSVIYIFWILVFFMIYFAIVSYSLIPVRGVFKKTFHVGYKHWKTLLPVYVLNCLLGFVAFVFAFMFMRIRPFLALAIFVFLVFPVVHFTRLFIIRYVRRLK